MMSLCINELAARRLAGAVRGHEHVVLQADAAEVVVAFEGGVVHKVAANMLYCMKEQFRFLEEEVMLGRGRIIDVSVTDPQMPIGEDLDLSKIYKRSSYLVTGGRESSQTVEGSVPISSTSVPPA